MLRIERALGKTPDTLVGRLAETCSRVLADGTVVDTCFIFGSFVRLLG
jgi:hypothetical protein